MPSVLNFGALEKVLIGCAHDGTYRHTCARHRERYAVLRSASAGVVFLARDLVGFWERFAAGRGVVQLYILRLHQMPLTLSRPFCMKWP